MSSDIIPGTPLVQAHNVKMAYGNTVAIDSSTFQIPAGKVTAVIGPNGSGKSTLLQAIAGILTPVSGELRVMGETPDKMRDQISFVMQSVVFPTGTPITVKDVVSMGRYAHLGWFRRFGATDRKAVTDAMEVMNITHLQHRHLEELSGGQRQRVYVAQGLAQDHEILMLDEPMTGLDIGSMRIIDKVIHDEADRGHSVILTTHDLNEAAAADHVVLVDGKVVASGTPDEVLTRDNLEEAYGAGSVHEVAGLDTGLVDLPACGPFDSEPATVDEGKTLL